MVWKEPFIDSEFHRGKIQPFCKFLKNIFAKKKTLACSASVYGAVSILCCEGMGRVVKNGRTNPLVTTRPRSSIRQTTCSNRPSHLRSGSGSKIAFSKNIGSLTHVFVNDPTKMCIIPITRKYYSDTFAIVPIINKKLSN